MKRVEVLLLAREKELKFVASAEKTSDGYKAFAMMAQAAPAEDADGKAFARALKQVESDRDKAKEIVKPATRSHQESWWEATVPTAVPAVEAVADCARAAILPTTSTTCCCTTVQ